MAPNAPKPRSTDGVPDALADGWHADAGRDCFSVGGSRERHRFIERMTSTPAWIQIPAYAVVFLSLELFSVTEEKSLSSISNSEARR